ncbi:hypothetical protein NMY22_g16786 [Coprinellus aureogranulatus]|nr:hypothetical protein NMY22_g16786 [Coprinellus aureogranulatus]
MRSGASGKVVSNSKRIRNFTIPGRAQRFNAASRPQVPVPLTQAQRAEERIAADQAIAERQQKHAHLPPIYEDTHAEYDSGPEYDALDILDGNSQLEPSHAGGELRNILDFISNTSPLRRKDTRKRRDRLKKRLDGFSSQITQMTDAFMGWCKGLGDRGLGSGEPKEQVPEDADGFREVQLLDTYSTYSYCIDIRASDEFPSCSAICNGLIPSAPFSPSYAVSIRALETFRSTHLRCPHLTIEPFLKGLCDVYGVQYRKALQRVFSICYDIYLQLRQETEKRVLQALGREGLWRRKNACPACTYRLQGEPQLLFSILVTMDGNNSLKRILRRAFEHAAGEEEDDNGAEQEDTRQVDDGLYLTREVVDRFQRGVESGSETAPQKSGRAGKSKQASDTQDADLRFEEDEDDPCASRWKNMKESSTERMWKLYDETGVFLCLCRHGFALTAVDMVQSGELSKYPLAVVEALLDAFGSDIGAGYDIGCRFGTTLRQSTLGARAKSANFTSLVGSFHGHAHNRLCQLSHLATYVPGIGLEDLEGCERLFSKSNALANATRYASPFHRRQAIGQYLKHLDLTDNAQNLSTALFSTAVGPLLTIPSLGKFITNNYRQALSILQGEVDLRKAIAAQGILDPDAAFPLWLAAERAYLQGLSKEPTEETLQMEYYQSLVDWWACEAHEAEYRTATAFVICSPNEPRGSAPSAATVARRRAAKDNTDNVEIRRVVTYMSDEENYLLGVEHELSVSNPLLAFHVGQYRLDRTRFFSQHRRQLLALSRMKGFTGDITPGIGIDATRCGREPGIHPSQPMNCEPPAQPSEPTPISPILSQPGERMDVDEGEEDVPRTLLEGTSDSSSEEESDGEVTGEIAEDEFIEAQFKFMEISKA